MPPPARRPGETGARSPSARSPGGPGAPFDAADPSAMGASGPRRTDGRKEIAVARPAAPKPRASEPRVAPVEEVLREVELLRSRGAYEAAVRHLEAALRHRPRATQELLSFELGSLLTHQLGDARRACAHWEAHQRRYSDGRYAEPVTRARELLGCRAVDGGGRRP